MRRLSTMQHITATAELNTSPRIMESTTTAKEKAPPRARDYGKTESMVLRVDQVSARGGQDGSYHLEPNGRYDTIGSSLDTGLVNNGFNRGMYRFVLEFDLGKLPKDALVQQARLSLSPCSPSLAGKTTIAGFCGDGRVTEDDFSAGDDIKTFTPSEAGTDAVDVTDFVIKLATQGTAWAGFCVRQNPLLDTGRSPANWHGPNSANAPQLVVEFKRPRVYILAYLQKLVGLA